MSESRSPANVPEGVPFVDFEREFDAPRAALRRAYGDRELAAGWLAPDGAEMTVDQRMFESGGGFRLGLRDPDGDEEVFRGVYHVVRPDLVVHTRERSSSPGVVVLRFVRFDDLDGGARSRIRVHGVYPSVEARDADVEAGIVDSLAQEHDRLAAMLAADGQND